MNGINNMSLIHKMKIAYHRRFGNRRKYLRKPLRVKVTENVSRVFEHFTSMNIGIGGMFLKTERPFAVDSNLIVEFSLPGEEASIIAEAKVVRTCPPGNERGLIPGMGINFTKLEASDKEKIAQFVNDPRVS